MPTAAFYTLGCKVNQYETEKIRAELERRGFTTVPFSHKADVYVINSCTVTGTADSKSRSAVRRVTRRNPDAVVVATGCYAELDPAAVAAIQGVDMVVPNAEKGEIAERIAARFANPRRNGHQPVMPRTRTRAVVKVQDGCSQFCAYCAVPYARSQKTSRPLSDVLEEIGQLADCGYKEVVLTGIRLGSYCDGDNGISALTEAVARIKGIERVRLSSIEAWEITDELLGAMASHPNVCRHLHIPLQTGDDDVLRAMRRPYDASRFGGVVEKARWMIDGLAVTTDIIVGFPGETDQAFENTLRLVERLAFSRLHVFRYSKRPRTLAAGMSDQVDERVKEERSSRLIALGQQLMTSFAARLVGQTVPVLVESKRPAPALLSGLTDNYVEVNFTGPDSLKGQVVDVEIERVEGVGLFGEVESLDFVKGGEPVTDCIFCKIANKEMGKLVYEDESVVAFDDLNPQALVHVLIIPRKHIERLSHVKSQEDACLLGHILTVASKIAADRGVTSEGYRVLVNEGAAAGQSVWHLHFHLLGGRKLGWPPG